MQFLDPKVDFVFKKVFGNQAKPQITIDFLNTMLDLSEGKKIVELVFIDPYNNPESIIDKKSVVDVKCVDQQGRRFIIEMQVVQQKYYPQRSQYYAAHVIARQMELTRAYASLMPVIFVGVLNFNMVYLNANPINRYCIANKTIEPDGAVTLVDDGVLNLFNWTFIELKKFDKPLEACITLTDKWLYLLQNANQLQQIPDSLGDNNSMYEALDLLSHAALTSEEREAYFHERDRMMQQYDQIETAKEIALAEGMEKGMEKGKQEAMIMLAKNMLKKFALEEVAEITGLSLDELKKLLGK